MLQAVAQDDAGPAVFSVLVTGTAGAAGLYNNAMQKKIHTNAIGIVEAVSAESFHVLPGTADAGMVLLCDHANNAFPPGYGTLGLPPEQLVRHIAYDIGAAEVTRLTAKAINAPAVLTHYSRLVIDPNRGEDDPTLIMRISDGSVVPGNREIDDSERQKRLDQFYRPYHGAVDALIDKCCAVGKVPALLSIHSFTEAWRGKQRPWHAAILWDQDGRLAVPMLEGLRAPGDIIVGDNEPYTGRLKGDCMWRHGTMRGLAHCIVEIRQDLIRDTKGQEAWAQRLAGLVTGLLRDPEHAASLGKVEYHVSNADVQDGQG